MSTDERTRRSAHRLSHRLLTAAAAGLMATSSLAACGPDDQGDRIRIGVMLSTTGPLAELGTAQLDAARLAVEEINASGGVMGKKLSIVLRDDGADRRKADRAIDALLAEQVPVIIGTVSSTFTQRAAEKAAESAVVISGSASAIVRSDKQKGTLFRTCSSDAGEGRLLAARARDRSLTRAAILHREGEPELADGFAASFTAAGGEVVFRATYARGQTSYAETLQKVLEAGADAVLLDAEPVDGAQIVRDYLAGFPGTLTWLFTHAQQSPAFVEAVGSRNFGFPHLGTGPGTPTGRRHLHFATRWEAKYGAPPPLGAFTANVYDAVFLAALAIEQAKATSPQAIAAALHEVSLGGRALGPDELAEAVEAIGEGADVNYEGASGSVDFDRNGDTTAPYDIWKVGQDGIVLEERAVLPPTT